jgi:steroid 5-alpha reductase family enzyme
MMQKIEHIGIAVKDAEKSIALFNLLLNQEPYKKEIVEELIKKNPENKGKNCEVGLWYYSRHPNYFFEWLIWVSYGLVSLASPYGYIGLISPVLMYILLTKFSGVPMSEELALKKRGDVFREYQRTTSAFFPWFKKG